MDQKLNGKWTKFHAALKYAFTAYTSSSYWCAFPFCLYLCCLISLSISISFCLSPSCTLCSHFSQREGSTEGPINTNDPESQPEEGLSAPVLILLFSCSSPLSSPVNWIESSEFLRFPEVNFLWSGFRLKDNKDNRARFFFFFLTI